MTDSFFPRRQADDIRLALLNRHEVALVDVREEASYAEGHPLFAANIPLSRLEDEVLARIPRRTVPVTLYDNGEGLAAIAARRLLALGYRDVALLADGLAGWTAAGGELFIDVNSPSKAFGELVAHCRQTPFLAAEELKRLLDAAGDIAVLDVRRFDEYQTMNIPGGISVPGAELVLRVRDLVPSPATRIIVNCAGRTRGIIGAQSLINAGIPNPVAALHNGTIGWMLAGLPLERSQRRRYPAASETARRAAAVAAREVADRAGVKRLDAGELQRWLTEPDRTTYVFDVRQPEEYAAGHFPAARPVPGGQLVQETDHYASVRGARVVLTDGEGGTRADMTASWLAQMGWQVWVLDKEHAGVAVSGSWAAPVAEPSPDDAAFQSQRPLPRRYRRPYEGTGNSPRAMQDYITWELGLVAQLERDGSHGFFVLK